MRGRKWDFLTGDPAKDQRNVDVLLDSVEEMYGRRSVEDRIRSAVDRAILVTEAERGFLLVPDESGELKTRIARTKDGETLPLDEPYSTTVVKRVWESGRPFVTVDVADSSVDTTESIMQIRLLSVMGVPLPVEGRNIGVLYVDSTKAVRSFTDSDLSVFKALGGMIGNAVERARLMAEEEARERMKRDLLLAQEIQQGFLPETLHQPEGFDIAGVGVPCEETSGDYYDVIPHGDGRVALIVGDVSDHGLGPAMVMASTRALLHGILASHHDPLEVIASVNHFMERDTPDDTFMTMFLGALEPRSRTMEYVSAGHNAPLLWRPDGSVDELTRTGMGLGILPNAPYRVRTFEDFEPGTILMLFTDGLFEAKNVENEIYGEERLRDSFARHAQGAASAGAVVEGVVADLTGFVGDRPSEDDLTCLVVRAL